MTSKIFFSIILVISVFSCSRTTGSQGTTNTEETTVGKYFGEEFEPQNVIKYADLEALVSGADSLDVQVRGTVSGVCQSKGCWMNLVDEQNTESAEMMVRFKDYGFFMPFDIAGREVIVNGKAYYQTTSVDELRHYAEDAGKSPEEIAKITDEEYELRFYADGVILVGEE